MNRTTIFTAALALALTACGSDPNKAACSQDEQGNYTSPLYPGLSQAQKDNCTECGSTECDAGETGGDEAGQVTLYHLGTDDPFVMPIAYDGVLTPLATEVLDGLWKAVPVNDCPTLSDPYPCARSWYSSPDEPGQHCRLCNSHGLNSHPPADSNEGWELCPHPYGEEHLVPAVFDQHGQEGQGAWLEHELTCDVEGTIDGFSCPLGFVGIWQDTEWYLGNTLPSGAPHTCICAADGDLPSDDYCQPGAVCEGGYEIKDGLPSPTLCVPEGSEGDANGIAPEGPEVYGLDVWSDGLVVDGNTVRVTPSFWLAAFGHDLGALDDDQRIDYLTGEITHCGRESLCEHLGFAVGDVLDATGFDPTFETGPQSLRVTYVDGSSEDLRIELMAAQ